MKKRLLVTGAKGFVAGSVLWQAGNAWDVHGIVRRLEVAPRDGIVFHNAEMRDSARLRDLFLEIEPDAVIHTAAVADIDFCESNKDVAEAVNMGATRDIASLCAESGARLVHVSTDTVFDGAKGMYREADPTGPVNFYGETKARAEDIVKSTAPGAAVPRLALVMGLPFFEGGNSFLARMIASIKQGREVGVPEDEIRTPADVVTLGSALLELAGNDYAGFIHLAGNERMNRYEASLRIADRLQLPRSLVVSKNSGGMTGRAPRPRDVSLDNTIARSVLNTPMLGLEDGLDLVLKTIRNPVSDADKGR